MLNSILLLTLFVGTGISVVVGTIWYMPNTPMGKIHMQYLGFDKLSTEERQQKIAAAKPTIWKLYVVQMLFSFLTAAFVVFVVTISMRNGVPLLMAMGFPVLSWFCFAVPTAGSALLWSNCERKLAIKKFVSDITMSLVTIVLIAYMTSLFV